MDYNNDLPEIHPLVELFGILGFIVILAIGATVAFTPWLDLLFKGFGI